MAISINLRKGLDINIRGAATVSQPQPRVPAKCAIIPDDYPGITPKVDVKEGDRILVGTPLIHDKQFCDLRIVSPVAGTVEAVVRGERRKLERIVITPDTANTDATVALPSAPADRATAQSFLLETGLWAQMHQRPYGIVPRPGVDPRDIFITTFDSAPLAPEFEAVIGNKLNELNAAVALLKLLTDGNVYVGVRPGSAFEAIKGAKIVTVSGPHPAGNVGVQIANVKPVNKGDVVWTLDLPTLLRIGEACSGKLTGNTVIAITGSEVAEPKYVLTKVGADMASLIKGETADNAVHQRVISGNVLTGTPVCPAEGFLRAPYTQVTVIAEGDDVADFLGWASLSPKKMSVSRSFPGHFLKKAFSPDARILGGKRAMIMSGVYDKVLPMDIMPEYLIKACIARDLDRMEQLGIYEILPEDIALCEYVDPSKIELQKILGDALDYMYKELN
jgi:Na+-transporting NADH:ubiquinone oxidoreductase subunit A